MSKVTALLLLAVLNVSAAVYAEPILSVSPTFIDVTTNFGGSPTAQTVAVSNAGNGALKWSVIPSPVNWATETPLKGTNAGTITVSFSTGNHAPGEYFTSITVTGSNQSVVVNVRVVVGNPPPPPPSVRGPTTAIACPAGAVDVFPGVNIQSLVTAHPAGTAFCIRAGTHAISYETIPKTGNKFIGEYGAVLDGSGWVTSDIDAAAFRASFVNVDDVLIQNLRIINMPWNGVASYKDFSDRWTVDHCDLSFNKRAGVTLGNDSVISNNVINNNVNDNSNPNPLYNGGGYNLFRASNVQVVNNEIGYNGSTQKMTHTFNVTFSGNWVHHNLDNGIWYDGDNPGLLVENNIVEDNAHIGIFIEISIDGTVRNNTVRRNGWHGIALVTSKQITVSGNVLDGNGRGIGLYVNCGAPIGGGEYTGWDLADNLVQNNTITVPATGGSYANGMDMGGCDSSQAQPYLNNAKNNRFVGNTYIVPNTSGSYWHWGSGALFPWSQWQSLGQDATGSIQ
jgi:parallel beta-helix repeat protein